jgi:hypothetical protein
MTRTSAEGGLDQSWPEPPLSELATLAARMAKAPGLARRMLPRLARGQLAVRTGRGHPRSVDLDALARWDRRVERLLGRLPA